MWLPIALGHPMWLSIALGHPMWLFNHGFRWLKAKSYVVIYSNWTSYVVILFIHGATATSKSYFYWSLAGNLKALSNEHSTRL